VYYSTNQVETVMDKAKNLFGIAETKETIFGMPSIGYSTRGVSTNAINGGHSAGNFSNPVTPRQNTPNVVHENQEQQVIMLSDKPVLDMPFALASPVIKQ